MRPVLWLLLVAQGCHTVWEVRERSTHALWSQDFELHGVELDRIR
jgi:hypothetical protein